MISICAMRRGTLLVFYASQRFTGLTPRIWTLVKRSPKIDVKRRRDLSPDQDGQDIFLVWKHRSLRGYHAQNSLWENCWRFKKNQPVLICKLQILHFPLPRILLCVEKRSKVNRRKMPRVRFRTALKQNKGSTKRREFTAQIAHTRFKLSESSESFVM